MAKKSKSKKPPALSAPEPSPKGGRPCKFSENLAKKIFELAKKGATDAEIARAIKVSRSTLSLWKDNIAGFSDILKTAKDVADEMVMASLFQRAVGYSHSAVKIFCTKEGEIIVEKFVERYPPDTTACIFWLKNRRRGEWTETGKGDDDGLKTIKVIVEEYDEN